LQTFDKTALKIDRLVINDFCCLPSNYAVKKLSIPRLMDHDGF
jgi:hypothetical protein